MTHPIAWLMQTFALLSPVGQGILLLWILGMIAVPILKWTLGSGAERIGITIGVLLQIALVLSILLPVWGVGRTLAAWIAVSGLGWLSEVIGSRTGIPYGPYHYTTVLQPQVMRVPVIIPLAWMMMMPPAWAIGHAASAALGVPGSAVFMIILSALAFTAWDLYLDPQMVHWDFWRWERKGLYFGIPLINYLGWFLVAAAITALVGPSAIPAPPLLLVYFLTWILQAIAQLAFWRLVGPGIFGLLGMGVMAVLAWMGIP
ncbi:carotenoid biosynthesis protein [Spirochaeta africana]|uniref:Putative membrane protein n=1 Tax=Spirochaeta africana (strain ATCC 700263 / DSM 8902 / Z-7692) TaxID=889378 RepID=H9UIL8_SPIAZ|nr:carotenoid biosynthesis protein [Spirochaeta africana]AFG37361.1 putative membrane protein [Spirochaeta africana DSM 8902]